MFFLPSISPSHERHLSFFSRFLFRQICVFNILKFFLVQIIIFLNSFFLLWFFFLFLRVVFKVKSAKQVYHYCKASSFIIYGCAVIRETELIFRSVWIRKVISQNFQSIVYRRPHKVLLTDILLYYNDTCSNIIAKTLRNGNLYCFESFVSSFIFFPWQFTLQRLINFSVPNI